MIQRTLYHLKKLRSSKLTLPIKFEMGSSSLPKLYYWQGKKNFGDILSFEIAKKFIFSGIQLAKKFEQKKIIGLGSCLQFSKKEDIVWGTGIHPFFIKDYARFEGKKNLKIYCVRGPITRNVLLDANEECPNIYGDPALLIPLIYKPEKLKEKEFIILPHHSEINFFKDFENFISPETDNWQNVINEIFSAKKVISSSLHGIIVAEAYGIDAVWLRTSEKEGFEKFLDYYLSTERIVEPARSIEEAKKVNFPKPKNLKTLQENLLKSAEILRKDLKLDLS